MHRPKLLFANTLNFQIKHGTATTAIKICFLLQQQITLNFIFCLVTDSIVIVIQMNHA